MNCPNPYCVMRNEDNICCNNFKEEPDYPTYCESLKLYLKHNNNKLGFGNCPECVWFNSDGACNVERDSKECLLNKKARNKLVTIPRKI